MAAETLKQNPQINLTLTDIDPKMVTAARNRLGGGHHITIEQADATQLPLPDQSFDYVLNYLMLHHVIEWPSVLAEIHRVLKPGGRLLGYDLTDTRIAHVVHWADRSPFKLISPTELEHGLNDAGFSDVQVRLSWAGHVMRFSARRDSRP